MSQSLTKILPSLNVTQTTNMLLGLFSVGPVCCRWKHVTTRHLHAPSKLIRVFLRLTTFIPPWLQRPSRPRNNQAKRLFYRKLNRNATENSKPHCNMSQIDPLARSRKRVFNSVFAPVKLSENAPTPLATPALGSTAQGQPFGSATLSKVSPIVIRFSIIYAKGTNM